MHYQANKDKNLSIEVNGIIYERIPIKTHVITGQDQLIKILDQYVKPIIKPNDIVFLAEKIVACMQQRAKPIKDIKPRWLATKLSKYVYKSPYGIGLSMPETMEVALQECGTPRILFAATASVVGKSIGKKGWFYNVAGDKARAIDGPCDYTLPPYNEYVILGPENPDKVAEQASNHLGVDVIVVDLNDLGGNILGKANQSLTDEWLLSVLKDNPLGQTDEQTPIGIIRKMNHE